MSQITLPKEEWVTPLLEVFEIDETESSTTLGLETDSAANMFS